MLDKIRYDYWKPFWCWALGHNIMCAAVIERYDSKKVDHWLWMCRRCVGFWDFEYQCGRCSNEEPRDKEDSGELA